MRLLQTINSPTPFWGFEKHSTADNSAYVANSLCLCYLFWGHIWVTKNSSLLFLSILKHPLGHREILLLCLWVEFSLGLKDRWCFCRPQAQQWQPTSSSVARLLLQSSLQDCVLGRRKASSKTIQESLLDFQHNLALYWYQECVQWWTR
jgi:hypothetical protein